MPQPRLRLPALAPPALPAAAQGATRPLPAGPGAPVARTGRGQVAGFRADHRP
jgi:hypothetical protein